MRRTLLAFALGLSLFTAHPAFAYTPITELAGDTTWTKAGGPYVVKNITIPAGITLTIEPGTVVKVVTDTEPFYVFGTLNIGNESGEQVLITSITDDTGGDTNEDGATTTPSSGDWRKISFNPGSTGTIVNTKIVYGGATVRDWWTGGYFRFPFIENKGGLLTLDNLTLTQGLNRGFDQYSGATTIMDSTFSDLTSGIYIVGGSIEFGNNSFSNLNDYGISVYSATEFINRGNNTGGRGIFMGNGISGNQTWAKDNIPYVASSVNIEAGASLTILPGAVVKVPLRISPFYVYGTLSIGASSSDQVLITSINDDSIGGDTNNDNADTTGVAGDWRFISVQPGGTLTTSHATFRYGGLSEYMSNGGWSTPPLIRNEGGNVMIDHSTFTGVNFEGIEQTAGTTTVTNSLFDHTGRYGTYSTGGYFTVSSSTFNTVNEGITAYGGTLAMQGNTFIDSILHDVNVSSFSKFVNHSGNMGSRGIFLDISTNGDLTLPKDGISYIAKSIYISSGNTLTITPGAVVKVPEDASPFYVYGTLNIGSASGEQVIITSEKDDSILGDSNGDSTSSAPSSGDWRTMTFTSGSSATIQNTIIHYAGASPYNSWTGGRDWLPVIKNDGGDLSFDQVTITDNGNYGILQSAGTTTLTNSEVSHTSHYGIFVSGGVATVHQSSIHNNVDYGVYNGSVDSIDATHNWWGAIGGPTHPSNPFGAGDKVTDNVDFGQWLIDEPLGACTTNCNSSVLFLPGIEASRLYAFDDPDCSVINCENQLWEPNRNDDVRKLFLDQNGKSTSAYDIYTRDIIDEVNLTENTPLPDSNIYESFIASMNAMVTARTINEWEAIPYDWRLSIDDIINGGVRYGNNISYVSPTTRSYIVDELRSLALHSKTGKVTIIAHSNGGLVAKALINKLGADAENLVDKIVFVAVPQVGTPQAVGALLHGYEQGLPKDWLPFFLSPATARAFASTSPMAYQLLPSQAYFHSEGIDTITPIARFSDGVASQSLVNEYGYFITNYSELQHFLLGNEGRPQPDVEDVIRPSNLKQSFLTYGENLHQLLDDNWTPPASIKIYQIAGFGNETLAGIHYWTGSKCTSMIWHYCLVIEPELVYTPENVVDGDGTVIMTSALAMSTSSSNVSRWWVDLGRYNNTPPASLLRLDVKHADILEVPELRQFISENILTSSVSSLPNFILASIPSHSSEKRLFFFLHSPLALSVHDSFGNLVNEATSTIPGGRFERYGEVQYISVPAISAPTLQLTGIETGSFTLEVKEVVGNTTLASTTFTGIPVLSTARVQMDFIDGTIEHALPLRVDVDGDGQADYSLAPKLGDIITPPSFDSTPPITTASTTGTLGVNNWFTSNVMVTLSVTDTESAVATTSYSLDSGTTWLEYTTPFTVSSEGTTTILFYSVDQIGNKEATNTLIIKIDKTPPEAMISVSTSTQDLFVEGKDALGSVMVHKDTSGNFILTDQSGHITKLFFQKTYSGKRLTYAKLTSIQYDANPKVTLPSSSFVYLWDVKTPITLVSQTIAVDGTYLIQAVYDKVKNKTTVLILKKRIPIKTQVFQGLRIPKLTTNKGVVGYSL